MQPAVKQSGLDIWSMAIRTSMANDPGRQILEDDIQISGFLFLEEYLEGILAGPKREALIELVKTPGRRKEVPRKTRVASPTKLKQSAKENSPLRIQKPLEKSRSNVLSPLRTQHTNGWDADDNPFKPVPVLDEGPKSRKATNSNHIQVTTPSSGEGPTTAKLVPPPTDAHELSMIVEGDENDARLTSTASAQAARSGIFSTQMSHPNVPTVNEVQEVKISTPDDIIMNDADLPPPIHPTHAGGEPVAEFIPPAPVMLPSLPAPSPLKPSARLSSVEIPVVQQLPSRTSWLVRARDARISEDTARLNLGILAVPLANSLKRKSDDSDAPLDTPAKQPPLKVRRDSEVEKPAAAGTKTPKQNGPPVLHTQTYSEQSRTQPTAKAHHPASTDKVGADQENTLDQLKKTVEGFSARAGTGLGKSFGSAAVNAAVQAKAAAEARLAQRFVVESTQQQDSTPEPTVTLAAHSALEVVQPPVDEFVPPLPVLVPSTLPLPPDPVVFKIHERPSAASPPHSTPKPSEVFTQTTVFSSQSTSIFSNEESSIFDKLPVQSSQDTVLSSQTSTQPYDNFLSQNQPLTQSSEVEPKASKDSHLLFASHEKEVVSAHMDEDTVKPPKPKAVTEIEAPSNIASQGLLSQATTLVAKAFGAKKPKPEVKSIHLAAQAAKKQQEEAEKKAIRMKDMEARRQQAAQRKEAEKPRALEPERSQKDLDEKKPKVFKKPTALSDDEHTQPRNPISEDKKTETRIPPKEFKSQSRLVKPVQTSHSTLLSSSTAKKLPPPMDSKAAPKPSELGYPAESSNATSSSKPLLTKAKVLQIQKTNVEGAAHSQVQVQVEETTVESESIELPDIKSEYSDSEDEDRPRTFDPPDWAQSPELRKALDAQSRLNPDTVFGAIMPLRMEDMFRSRQSRFRSRTSSANWGAGVTAEEERNYAMRMGYNT
ncbi:hypothetical protein SISNIDRAFT_549977 [Sistotremastrum niveocremeum HHB9708]|uniref:Inner centromere protein ARK-binding domain-containing protein n=1 Tax=Sistotremastrum niveocremeum HHB9708 TaxID=1314777 RepID=A0A164U5U2_9AGAM|nr:hypothetical protein SISNIDRAFT_549977 [Sistotremastrum niveocremeum HHB9708]